MGRPTMYDANSAPRPVIQIAEMVIPRLLVGEHPALRALRVQYERSRITSVELSGVGFFVDYEVPPELPLAVPGDFAGGNAAIGIAGLEHPAGCVLFVENGRLVMFEVFIFEDEWPQDAVVRRVDNVIPLMPPG